MQAITGNTYPVRDKLKALGGTWDAARRAWMVPDDKAEEARKLVPAAPARTSGQVRVRRGWRACGYPGCSPSFCDECDGKGMYG